MKNMFHIRWKPGGVLSGVSLGIKIHPPDPNGRQLLAFDCMSKIRLGQSIQWQGMKQVLTDISPFSSTKHSFKGHDDHIIEVFVPLRE